MEKNFKKTFYNHIALLKRKNLNEIVSYWMSDDFKKELEDKGYKVWREEDEYVYCIIMWKNGNKNKNRK